MDRRISVAFFAASVAACVPSFSSSDESVGAGVGPFVTRCDYPQVFGTSTHVGMTCPEVTGMTVVAAVVQDHDADVIEDHLGFLSVHESAPLTSGDSVVVPSKAGFSSFFCHASVLYSVQTLRWVPSVGDPAAVLTPAWTAPSDWRPVDSVVRAFEGYAAGLVPQFQPVIANTSVYAPMASGKLERLDLATGAVLATVDPLVATPFDNDPRAVVVDALSADLNGNVYYAVVAFPNPGPHGYDTSSAQPRGAWLVVVHPDNTFKLVDWDTIASPAVGVPMATDMCEYPFGTNHTPAATSPASAAPKFGCGRQRPAMNSPVAVSADGATIVAYSYANNAQGAAFLIVVDATTLAPTLAVDTRGRLLEGCGARLPVASKACKTITASGTTHLGFDPDFNGPVRFRNQDAMDSAPTISPTGDMTIAGYDGGASYRGGFDARGAVLVFDRTGALLARNERFGWEVTSAQLKKADGTFSYLQDEDLYSALDLATVQTSATTEADETRSTIPLPADPDRPDAIDWLDAHITYGAAGDHYAVNGNGSLYKLAADGTVAESVALVSPTGAERSMETLSSYFARDRLGRVYVSYAGTVYVVASAPPHAAPLRRPPPGHRGGFHARRVIDFDLPRPPTP